MVASTLAPPKNKQQEMKAASPSSSQPAPSQKKPVGGNKDAPYLDPDAVAQFNKMIGDTPGEK